MKQNSTIRLISKVLLKKKKNRYSTIQAKALLALPLLLAMLFLGTVSAEAASVYCVRADAAGANNGSDWDNAYTSLPASLVRGATYYIADGSYGSYTFDDAESGTSLITIKKATISDHGGIDAGWQSSYGDGQAFFGALTFRADYVTFDGNNTSGYGMVLNAGGNIDIRSCSNITIRSTSIDLASGGSDLRGLYLLSVSSLLVSNVESAHSENDCVVMQSTNNSTFEYFVCRDRRNVGGGIHGDAFEIYGSSNNTLRYSRINWQGQQLFWAIAGGASGRWDIYGNVFYGGASAGKGLCTESTDPSVGPIYLYNNTFQGLNMGLALRSNATGIGRNNIFYSAGSMGWGSMTNSSNTTASSDPFVNISSGNYHLKAAIAGDSSIGSAYNTDPDGTTRGSDGIWDRGALEYIGTSVSRISAPFNLSVN